MGASFAELLLLEVTNDEFEEILLGRPSSAFPGKTVGIINCKPINKLAIPVKQ
jgi:hypothetical protein